MGTGAPTFGEGLVNFAHTRVVARAGRDRSPRRVEAVTGALNVYHFSETSTRRTLLQRRLGALLRPVKFYLVPLRGSLPPWMETGKDDVS